MIKAFQKFLKIVNEAMYWILFLVFVFLCVCASLNNGRRNYSICLKIITNIYLLCGISSTVFARVEGYTKVSQYVIVYGGKFLLVHFNIIRLHYIFME